MDLYFAYGSNLKRNRLVGRVPSAGFRERAQLLAHRLTFDKRGRDGSGKATVAAAPDAAVWGVVYRLDPAHWPDLDRCEPGYRRVRVTVVSEQGEPLLCSTYVATDLDPGALPSFEYRQLLIDGAREHGLPEATVATLLNHPYRAEDDLG